MREPQMKHPQTKQPQPHPKKRQYPPKKRAATKESVSKAVDAEVLSDSSYDTDLAASSDSDEAWSDSDTEFDPDDEIVHEEDEGSSLVLLN